MPNIQRECLAFIPSVPGGKSALWFEDRRQKVEASGVIPNGDQGQIASSDPDGMNQYFLGCGFYIGGWGDIGGGGWDAHLAFEFWSVPIGSPQGNANTSAAEVGELADVGSGDLVKSEVLGQGTNPTLLIEQRFENFDFNEDAALQESDNQIYTAVPWNVPQD